jgi:hypothetical protein
MWNMLAGYIIRIQRQKRNFQNPSLVEVIATPIPEISYGDRLTVLLNPDEIRVDPSE